MKLTPQTLNMVFAIAEGVAKAVPAAIQAKKALQNIAEQDRDPSPQEWDALNLVSEELHRQAQGE